MMKKHVRRLHLKTILAFSVIPLLATSSSAAPSHAEDVSVEALKAGIEGAYALEEWQVERKVFRPPVVQARTVFLNGVLMYMAFSGAQEENKTTQSGYAKYVLEPGKFSYGYEGWTLASEKAGGVSITHDLPFQGLRVFAASIQNNELHLRATDGPQQYRFTAHGFSYTNGKETRVYRRVKDH
jgi:hypothetical protein